MRNAVTADEMHAIEEKAYASGITPLQLMENAGKVVVTFVKNKYKSANGILVVCGNGNNGGDGFVVARLLSKKYKVVVALLGTKKEVRKGPALQNLERLAKIGKVRIIKKSAQKIRQSFPKVDLVVDAIFGTGFHGTPNGDAEILIKAINKSRLPIVSVDLPSGLDATSGAGKIKVAPAYTVTFHKMKLGLLKSKRNGEIIVKDIGIPETLN